MPLVIISSESVNGGYLDLSDFFKKVLGEPIVAHSSVVPLDVGFLLVLDGLDDLNRIYR